MDSQTIVPKCCFIHSGFYFVLVVLLSLLLSSTGAAQGVHDDELQASEHGSGCEGGEPSRGGKISAEALLGKWKMEIRTEVYKIKYKLELRNENHPMFSLEVKSQLLPGVGGGLARVHGASRVENRINGTEWSFSSEKGNVLTLGYFDPLSLRVKWLKFEVKSFDAEAGTMKVQAFGQEYLMRQKKKFYSKKKSKFLREGGYQLRFIADKVVSYYEKTKRLPSSGAVVSLGCGIGVLPEDKRWKSGGWKQIGFRPDKATLWKYEMKVDKKNKKVTLQAFGDYDCNGKQTSRKVQVSILKNGDIQMSPVFLPKGYPEFE